MRACSIVIGLVVLTGACKNKAKDDALGHPSAVTSAPASITVVPDQIDTLVVKGKNGPEVRLTKRGDSWFVTAPAPESPAKAKLVVDALNNLSGVKLKEDILPAAEPDTQKSKEVVGDAAVHVVAQHGGATAANIWVGKIGPTGQLVRIDGSDDIWTASGVSSWTFDRSVDQWRGTADEAKVLDAEAACSSHKWVTICTLGRHLDNSEKTGGLMTFPSKKACEGAGLNADGTREFPCDPCRCKQE